MTGLVEHPGILEINTWVWLQDLSNKLGRTLTLGTVPEDCWDEIAAVGVDAIWLMGVWERSAAGTKVAANEEWLLQFGRTNFSDFSLGDIVGSPYCIRRYVPDKRMGGFAGLDVARDHLRARGMGLILDYVPNHVAPDHPWVTEHPEFFMHGTEADLDAFPERFVRAGPEIVALARDPFFPPWSDVLQLNALDPGVRDAAIATLSVIGEHCDGVRCDMANLLLNEVFAGTWDIGAGSVPERDFWSFVIPSVKNRHPDLTFIAEGYGNSVWNLLTQGFDYCYDKVLYDRLLDGDPEPVRLHVRADYSYQRRLVRFLENHDEPRSNAVFPAGLLRAAAVVISTLPGAVLYHDGQFTGMKTRVPVQLGRGPAEPEDVALQGFYDRLVKAGRRTRRGQWWFCDVTGWPDNDSCRNIVAWCWRAGQELRVVAVNQAAVPSQGLVRLPGEALASDDLTLTDAFTGAVYHRPRPDLLEHGLYVALDSFGFHLLTSQGW